MLSLFGFGKRRRKTSRKTSKKSGHKKPPSRLLKICKKYKVKTMKKVGGKKVYKPVKVLAKACLKKALAAAKKKKVHRKTGRKTRRRARFGMDQMKPGCGSRFGSYDMMKKSNFGMNDMMMRKTSYGSEMPFVRQSPSFGKRRGTRSKVSRTGAMKAFRAFYKRHCAGMRRSRFGNGGNPSLAANMGYEFCPSGMGGVLGAGSTGLFPSPCTTMNMGQAQAEAGLSLPAYSSSGLGDAASSSQLASYANMFGRKTRRVRRPRRRTSSFGSTKRRTSAVGSTKRRSTKKRSSAVGRKTGRKTRRVRRRVRRSD